MVGVFIAFNHQSSHWGGCWRWAHRTVRCATGHSLFSVRCATTSPNRYGSRAVDCWRPCLLVAPDSLVVHRTVSCPSDLCRGTVLHCSFVRVDHCALHSRYPAGTPDSPVNYSGARPRFPKSGWLDHVRSWCTGQSGAPDHNTLKFFLLLLNWVPEST